jgi:hypothetical protein
MNVTPPPAPAVAAAMAATQQAKNFTALGATNVRVSDAGIQLDFASPEAASIARAVLRDRMALDVPSGQVGVPVLTGDITGEPAVGIHDAAAAIDHLNGVVGAFKNTDGSMRVVTLGNNEELEAIVRPVVQGVPVSFETLIPPGGTGWGSGQGGKF